MCVCVSEHMHECVNMCMGVYECVKVYAHEPMDVHLNTWEYVSECICMHMCE